jgi:tetratricopeptide (TPR) repeat protein
VIAAAVSAALWLIACGCATPPAGAPADEEVARAAALGYRAFERGNPAVAVRAYGRALTRARLLNDPAAIGDCAYNLAACLVESGRFAEARNHLAEARAELAKANAGGAALAAAWLLEAKAARGAGDPAEAERLSREALAALGGAARGDLAAQTHTLQAHLACDRGDFQAAREALQRAQDARGRDSGRAAWRGAATAAEGRILLAESNATAAAETFDRAAGQFKDGGRHASMSETLALAAQAWEAAGRDGEAADRYLQAARVRFALGNLRQALQLVARAVSAAERAGDEDLGRRIAALYTEIVNTLEESSERHAPAQ